MSEPNMLKEAKADEIIRVSPDAKFVRLKRTEPKIVKSATEVIGEGQVVETIKNVIEEKVKEILEENKERDIRHDLNGITYVLKLLTQLQEINIQQNRQILWETGLIYRQNDVIISSMKTNQILNKFK